MEKVPIFRFMRFLVRFGHGKSVFEPGDLFFCDLKQNTNIVVRSKVTARFPGYRRNLSTVRWCAKLRILNSRNPSKTAANRFSLIRRFTLKKISSKNIIIFLVKMHFQKKVRKKKFMKKFSEIFQKSLGIVQK